MAERRGRLRVAIWMLLGWASMLPNPLWAENQGNHGSPAPPVAADNKDGIREEFLARLADRRSLAKRKEALVAAYGDRVHLRKEFQDHLDKLDSQIASLQSDSLSRSPSQHYQLQLLHSRRRQLQNQLTHIYHAMGGLVAEYDVLSRMEELESSYKNKGITKADFTSEDRGLREELDHVAAERQMGYLREDVMDGLAEIERQIMNMTQSLRTTSIR